MCFLFNISSDISLWYLILIVPLLIYAVLLFYKNDLSLNEMPSSIKKVAKFFRILTLIFLILLILSPYLKWNITELKKPLIIVAIDQSQSISINHSFNEQKKHIQEFLDNFSNELTDDYQLKLISFGSDVRQFDSLHFKDKQTNISQLLNHVQAQYEFENVGALVLLSDGNFNSGQNPLYMTQTINFPIYSVLLGDTSKRKDIFIDKLIYNPNQYTGINIKIQAQIKAHLLSGNKTTVKLIKNNELIDQRNINITSENYFTTITFTDYAERPGTFTYKIIVDSLKEEFLFENNSKIALIHISNQKQHIAIVSTFPHPDIGALFTALDNNPAFNVQITTPEKALDSLDKWNVMILYQIPNITNNASQLLKKIGEKQIPVLLVVGSQSNITNLSLLFSSSLIVQTKAGQFEDAFLHWENTENILNLPQDLKETFESFPPLLVPFGEYKIQENALILLNQKIKQVKTSKPLVVGTELQQGNKCIVIFGEGFFRWRMHEYLQKQQNTYFTTFFNKLVLYLLSKQKKERFIVQHKPIYNEGENITFEAELYNILYEPITDADISLFIESLERNESYTFYFEKNKPFYALNIRSLPDGKYKWTARSKYEKEQFVRQGFFVVQPHNVELQDYIANHDILRQLSLRTGGISISTDSLRVLHSLIKNQPNIVPISNVEETFSPLININWLLVIIALLISIEWLLRKLFGSI